MKRVGTWLGGLALAVGLQGCGAARPSSATELGQPPPTLAIVHATVLDGTGSPAQRDVTIVVSGERIVAMGPSSSVIVEPGVPTVDATGRFVIPGLWDLHVHLVNRPEPGLAEALLLPLFLAHGVVGVRDMGGDPARLAALRDQVRTRARRGPSIVMAGPFVDGPQPVSPFVLPVSTAEEARAAVATVQRAGADFVKVQSGLTPLTFGAVADEARRLGIPFAGHVPEAVDAADAVEAGQRSIEHVSPALTGDAGILLSCSRESASLRAELLSLEADSAKEGADATLLRARDAALKLRMLDTYDDRRCQALFARMVARGTRVVPTLVWSRTQLPVSKTEPADDPPVVPRAMRERWQRGRAAYLARIGGDDRKRNQRVADGASALVLALHHAGVPLLAGTDSFDAFVVPGASLHRELALLVAAGLSPNEVLRMATHDAATFVGQGDTRGTLERGKLAELIILDADPLLDIASVGRIHAVVAQGALLDRAELDRMRAGVEAAAAGM